MGKIGTLPKDMIPAGVDMPVRLIRSARRTASLEFRNGELTVRAPLKMPEREIASFLEQHVRWIRIRQKKAEETERMAREAPPLTGAEIAALKKSARLAIPERIRFWAPRAGVTYGKISIRCQRTRWGSCSARGDLSFNCLLMLAPPEVLDGVVVHELCHRKEMNHSRRFYTEVARLLPDFRKREKWLKENGPLLLKRVERGKSENEE